MQLHLIQSELYNNPLNNKNYENFTRNLFGKPFES
jgi:hypothetical protein